MRSGASKPITVRLAKCHQTRDGIWRAEGFVIGCKDPLQVRSEHELSDGRHVRVRPVVAGWEAIP